MKNTTSKKTVSMQDHLFKKVHRLLDDLEKGLDRIEKYLDELDKEEAEEKPKLKLRLVK